MYKWNDTDRFLPPPGVWVKIDPIDIDGDIATEACLQHVDNNIKPPIVQFLMGFADTVRFGYPKRWRYDRPV